MSSSSPPASSRLFGSPWVRYAASIGAVGAALAFRLFLLPVSGPGELPFISFYPALVFAAWFGRLYPGLLALGLSALAADWFFIEPMGGPGISMSLHRVGLAVFIGCGGSMILVVEAMHRANDRARKEIEERKRSEAALFTSQQTLTTMYRSLPVGITLNRIGDGRYVEVNDCFARMTGYGREDLIGKTSEDLGMVPDLQKRREVLDRIGRDGSASNTVIGITRKSGERRYFMSNSAVVTLDGQEFILSSSLDVTDRRRADEEIHRLNADLDRRVQERTRELEAFTYTVAHDLRSPIRAMQGFADLVLADAGDRLQPQESEYLSRIARAAQRMDVLVCDLLTYSRLGLAELNSEPIDLDGVVREALHHLEPELRSRQAEVVIEPALPPVLGDRTGIVQALINLVSNAAKFSRAGVSPVIRISARTRPGWVRVLVEDNGIGVDPKHRPKLFGIFERLHAAEAYPGTGIGLAIVRRVIDRMGGKVGMESADGPGSRFWFDLASATLPPDEASVASNPEPVSETC